MALWTEDQAREYFESGGQVAPPDAPSLAPSAAPSGEAESLDAWLDVHGLSRLAEALRSITAVGLDEQFELGRSSFLSFVKQLGIEKLADRQALANAVAKSKKEGWPAGGAASRKPRVLCLHGTATNSSIFKKQLQALLVACKDEFDFEFLDAEQVIDESHRNDKDFAPMMRRAFPEEKEFRAYCPTWLDDDGASFYENRDAAFAQIEAHLASRPAELLLGFSSGSDLAANPLIAQEPSLFVEPISTAAIIVSAKRGAAARGAPEKASQLFATPPVHLQHPENHRPLPADGASSLTIIQGVRDFLRRLYQ
ncbi:hypothetical protein AB1Y20_007398 [Prymnesium parvum]|uniref:Serine hydrolase domain-containing protein n=1 Tax=Prymnesium parvum TaxID=97485 RepID=A0AB34IXE0_PRYPA